MIKNLANLIGLGKSGGIHTNWQPYTTCLKNGNCGTYGNGSYYCDPTYGCTWEGRCC